MAAKTKILYRSVADTYRMRTGVIDDIVCRGRRDGQIHSLMRNPTFPLTDEPPSFDTLTPLFGQPDPPFPTRYKHRLMVVPDQWYAPIQRDGRPPTREEMEREGAQFYERSFQRAAARGSSEDLGQSLVGLAYGVPAAISAVTVLLMVLIVIQARLS